MVQQIKISLITVTYNAGDTIRRCIESVISQTYTHVEYIIIDGNSADHTRQIVSEYEQHIHIFKSEKDEGIYDAMNKGILLATGDVIGMLNADDYFTDEHVLNKIAQTFTHSGTDLFYADLNYVNHEGNIVRKWRSDPYKAERFNWGWMPAHPTFYAKRELFDRWGGYNMDYGTAADYELMLRFMYLKKANVFYLNEVIVNMVSGGVSNVSFKNRIRAWASDFKAMKNHRIRIPLLSLMLKPLRKFSQFVIQ